MVNGISLNKSPLLINIAVIASVTIFLLFLLYLYNGIVDDFAPGHVAVGYYLEAGKNLEGLLRNKFLQAPAFSIFITIIRLITGLQGAILPVFPIQLVPYMTVTLAFFHSLLKFTPYLSNIRKKIFSVLLTLIMLSQSAIASDVFLWLHSLGKILFISLLLVLIHVFEGNQKNKLLAIYTLIMSILVLVSYDVSFWPTLYLLGVLSYKYLLKSKSRNIIGNLILSIVLFLSYTFYVSKTYKIVFDSLSILNLILSTYKLMVSYLGLASRRVPSELVPLLINYPRSLSMAYVAKYVIYFILMGLPIEKK